MNGERIKAWLVRNPYINDNSVNGFLISLVLVFFVGLIYTITGLKDFMIIGALALLGGMLCPPTNFRIIFYTAGFLVLFSIFFWSMSITLAMSSGCFLSMSLRRRLNI